MNIGLGCLEHAHASVGMPPNMGRPFFNRLLEFFCGGLDLFEFLFDQELSVILEAAGQALPGGPDGGLSAGFGELAGDEGGLGGDEAVEGVGDGVDADGAVEAVPFDGAEVLVDGGAGGCSAHDTAGAGG